MTRYAVYFAPDANTALWRFGSACIGYDAWRKSDVPHPDHPSLNALDLAALTEEPRRYGFHATLKAPFELKRGRSEVDLLDFAAIFAAAAKPFSLPQLKVAALGRFIALVPSEHPDALHRLAEETTRAFEAFRAPLGVDDQARRLAQPLSERQKAHLLDFGYPHIFEDFRFHMTLTGSLSEDARKRLLTALRDLYDLIDATVAIDAISIFRQPSRNARFTILERLPFTGG